jgi:hypothetical protein
MAVGVDGEKEGELVSLENVLRYWRALEENWVVFRNPISSCL